MEVKRESSAKPPHYSRVVETVLWSDPQVKQGCVSNKKRGVGCRYGPDVASTFMRDEELRLVRAVDSGRGWQWGAAEWLAWSGHMVARVSERSNCWPQMIRSHECVMEGVEWPFGGPEVEPRVCTLFSASNYGSKSLNK
ncbi:MAG: hypothetical protein SGPRY_014436, partial [Prymnesium sp.]